MLYQHLIWDFDGTLFDSYPHTHAAYLRALEESGREVDPDTLMQKLRVSFVEAHNFVRPTPEIIFLFNKYRLDASLKPISRPYDGVAELLKATGSVGIRHYLFTHSGNEVIGYLEEADLAKYFTDFVTRDNKDAFELKPSPKAIQYLVEKHRLEKSECAMVGDREIDIASGVNAGIDGILFDEFDKKPQTAAKYTVSTVSALKDLLMS